MANYTILRTWLFRFGSNALLPVLARVILREDNNDAHESAASVRPIHRLEIS
jgi:hypothetical protein